METTDTFIPTEYGKRYTVDMLKAHQRYHNAAGKRVAGVTTVLDMLAKHGLYKWYWQCGIDGRDPEKVRDEAAAVGTVAHARVEAYLRGLEFDASGITLERMKQSGFAFAAFKEWWGRERYQLVASELQLVSEKWQVGGTLDILARRDGELALVDIKTSNGLYREHRLQVAAYAALYEETHPGERVARLMLVRIPKEEAGVIEPVEITNRADCEAAFGALAQTYRLLSKVR
jgi:CRISPR/Cas system-associated exonuclease Cas4 (RecB family)